MINQDKKFYEWDYDNNKLIEWLRQGECNGCGQCCKDATITEFEVKDNRDIILDPDNDISRIVPHFQDHHEGGNTTNGKGSWSETEKDGERRFFGNLRIAEQREHIPCQEWSAGGGCGLHKTGKPFICVAFPMKPSDIATFDECSYTFTKVGEQKLNQLDE